MYAPCDQSRNKNIKPNKYSGKVKRRDEYLVKKKTTAYRKTLTYKRWEQLDASSLKKRLKLSCVTAFCSNMDRPRDYHTKLSQTKTYSMWYLLYVELKIGHKCTYQWNKKQTHRRRKQSSARQWGGREEEFGISRGKLSYMWWINNKVLLYNHRKLYYLVWKRIHSHMYNWVTLL